MDEQPTDNLEQRLRQAARALPYPPTPDVVAAMRQRRARQSWRWFLVARMATALVVVVALLLAVPEVRAAALAVLRIGAIQIVPATTTTLPPTTLPPAALLADLRGATSLAEARARLPFALRLPTLPADLGPPDDVFVQDLAGPAAILVWRDRAEPSRPRLALFVLSEAAFGAKLDVQTLAETTVRGQRALWASGPYLLQLGNAAGELTSRRLVTGNTLIWEEDGLTYRLESDLPLEAAVRIAESLR